MIFSNGAVAVRDTIPAMPPANNALHIIMDGGGSGGGTKSEPAIIITYKLKFYSNQIVTSPISTDSPDAHFSTISRKSGEGSEQKKLQNSEKSTV